MRYAILDRKEMDEGHQMLPRDFQQTSLMVSESETEEELIFESTQNHKSGGDANVSVRTNHKVPNGKVPAMAGRTQNSNT